MELVAGALDAAVQALRDGLGSDDKAARLMAAKALLTRSAANARQQGQGSAGRRETHARGPGQSTRILPSPRGWPPTLAGKSRRLARDRKRGDDGAVMPLGNPSAANRVEEEITKMKKLLLAGATGLHLPRSLPPPLLQVMSGPHRNSSIRAMNASRSSPTVTALSLPFGRARAFASRSAGARANIRFKFQAMVTRLHSPRAFSNPRIEN